MFFASWDGTGMSPGRPLKPLVLAIFPAAIFGGFDSVQAIKLVILP
jgi:hypothetical protein